MRKRKNECMAVPFLRRDPPLDKAGLCANTANHRERLNVSQLNRVHD